MSLRLLLVMCLGLAPSAPLCAQGDPRRLDRLEPKAAAAVARIADAVSALGVPRDPLYAKVAEGILKGATDERIVASVRNLARELTQARDALGPSASDADVIAGASAVHMGVTPAAIRRLRESREKESGDVSLTTPLVVLADLVSRRVPVDLAVSSLESLIAHGAPDGDLAILRTSVERDINAGSAPTAATTTRTQALLQVMSTRPKRP